MAYFFKASDHVETPAEGLKRWVKIIRSLDDIDLSQVGAFALKPSPKSFDKSHLVRPGEFVMVATQYRVDGGARYSFHLFRISDAGTPYEETDLQCPPELSATRVVLTNRNGAYAIALHCKAVFDQLAQCTTRHPVDGVSTTDIVRTSQKAREKEVTSAADLLAKVKSDLSAKAVQSKAPGSVKEFMRTLTASQLAEVARELSNDVLFSELIERGYALIAKDEEDLAPA